MKWTLLLTRLACLLDLAIMLAQSPAWALDTDVVPELGAMSPNSQLNPGYVHLTRNEIDALILAHPDRLLNLPTLERFTGNEPNKLPFVRTGLFASGVRFEPWAMRAPGNCRSIRDRFPGQQSDHGSWTGCERPDR